MTIVCATRFTEESSFAVVTAAALAKKAHVPLWLVHVLPLGLNRTYRDNMTTAAEDALRIEAHALGGTGIEVHTAVLHGKLDQSLSEFCTQKNATLLLVGDTAQKFTQVRAGTLDKLAHGVEAPLLVVRDARPFHAWVEGKSALKVMLALDKSSSAAVARDWVCRLANFGAIELIGAQIWWPLEEYERRRLEVPDLDEGHMELSATMRTEAVAALSGLPSNVTTRVHLEIGVGNIGEQLLDMANENQVDLVLVGTHRRRALGRLWSVSHQLITLAPMSVACIPSTVVVPDLATIPRFQTAIAATNFSETGNRAITHALGLVGRGTVHVVHVAAEPFSAAQEKVLLQKLVSVLPPNAEADGARVIVHVLHGDVADELAKASRWLGADVVCIGMRAESETPNPAIFEVLRRSGRPVLIPPVVNA